MAKTRLSDADRLRLAVVRYLLFSPYISSVQFLVIRLSLFSGPSLKSFLFRVRTTSSSHCLTTTNFISLCSRFAREIPSIRTRPSNAE